MSEATAIRVGQEVVGSDGVHVGTVAAVSVTGITVARIESGTPVDIPLFLVAAVGGARVRLSEPAAAAAARALRVDTATKDGVTATPGTPPPAGAHGPLPPVVNRAVGSRAGRGNFYLPWIVGVVGALLIVLPVYSCTRSPPPPPPPAAPVAAADRSPAAAQPMPVQTIRLPDGASITTAQNSTAFQLVRYLASDQPAGRVFTLNGFVFAAGSSDVPSGAAAEIDATATILAAFPHARIRVTGRADPGRANPGADPQGGDRARAIARALTDRGVAGDRIELASGDKAPDRAERKHDPDPRTKGGPATITVLAR